MRFIDLWICTSYIEDVCGICRSVASYIKDVRGICVLKIFRFAGFVASYDY